MSDGNASPSWAGDENDGGDDYETYGDEKEVKASGDNNAKLQSSGQQRRRSSLEDEDSDDGEEAEDFPLATTDSNNDESPDSWKQHQASLRASSRDPGARRSCLHGVFRLLKVISVATALTLFISQVISVAYYPVNPVEVVLKLYMMTFCILMVCTELECCVGQIRPLTNWVLRGYFYAFVGIVGIEQNHVTGRNDIASAGHVQALMFIEVASWMVAVVGMIYFFLGIFCCQLVYKRAIEKYEKKKGTIKSTENNAKFNDKAVAV